MIGKKNVASEFLLSISAYFTFAHTPFTRTIYFCHLRIKGVPSVVLRNTDLKCAQEEEKSYTTIREEAAKKWLFLAFQIFTRTTFVRKKILDIPPEF